MSFLSNKIDEILNKKGLTRYKLCQLTEIKPPVLSQMITGKRPVSKNIREKILPFLEVSPEEFESWIIAGKYPKNIIENAIEFSKKREDKKKNVLTQNIDKMLSERNLSRTALSKLIGNSQSGLNRVIASKESLSKNVAAKFAGFFEIPEENLQAWVLADKYSLKALELALKI